MKAADKKATIYVDIDDEITAIIDKLLGADQKIIALVLPKRAVVLQSSVNMRLLKKAADSASKNIVLITTETPLLPLAGAAGIHVAASLSSKPAIPKVPSIDTSTIDAGELVEDEPIDRATPIGALTGDQSTDAETIELDNTEPETIEEPTKKASLNKKLRVPNFNSFRLRLLLGGAAIILLIVGWYVMYMVLPKAEIVVRTDTKTNPATIAFTTSTKSTALDEDKAVVPAKLSEIKKTDTDKAPATGEKDVGTKASGSVTMSILCSAVQGSPPQIPAGTGVSAGNLTFITQAVANLTTPDFSDGCRFVGQADVVAQNNGDQYNLSPRSYTVAGFSSVSATGTAMSGGTSKLVKVVSDQDVDTAKQKLLGKNQNIQDEVRSKLQSEGLLGIVDTFQPSDPVFTITPKVGEEGAEVTVTQVITYTMLGVKQTDLETLLKKEASKTIDTNAESIRGYGFDKAIFRITERLKSGDIKIALDTLVVTGPEIREDDIKTDTAGKKKATAASAVRGRSGVIDVQVNIKPFYAGSVPKNKAKITVKIEQNDSGSRAVNP